MKKSSCKKMNIISTNSAKTLRNFLYWQTVITALLSNKVIENMALYYVGLWVFLVDMVSHDRKKKVLSIKKSLLKIKSITFEVML